MTTILSLPEDLMYEVFGLCALEDASRAALTCSVFARALMSDGFWRRLVKKDFPDCLELYTQSHKTWRRFYFSLGVFSTTHKHKSVAVSANRLSVVANPGVSYWGTVQVAKPVLRPGQDKGRRYFEVYIDNCPASNNLGNSWKIVVGVVRGDYPYTFDKLGGYALGYIAGNGYIVGPKFQSSGKEYGPRFETGDKIGVLVDFSDNSINFYKNGEDLGCAFENFPEAWVTESPTYPVIDEYYFMCALSIHQLGVTIQPGATPTKANGKAKDGCDPQTKQAIEQT